MYTIKREGKRVPTVLKNTFNSYDEARQVIRKWLRVQINKGKVVHNAKDKANRTVTIGLYGFSVIKR